MESRRDVAPVFSDYKWKFAVRRFGETCLSGARVLVGEENECVAPRFIFMQMVCMVVPCVVGIGLLMGQEQTQAVLRAGAGGVVTMVLTIALRAFGRFYCMREGGVEGKLDIEKVMANMFSDEEQVDLKSRQGIWKFFFQTKETPETVGFMLTRGIASFLLSFVVIYSSRENNNWSWVSYAMAHFALAVRHPVEIAQWDTGTSSTYDCFTRGLHVIGCCAIFGFVGSPLVTCLPIFWALGIVPSVPVLIEWVLEQVVIYGFGGSAASSSRRVLMHFLSSLAVTGIIFVLFLYVEDVPIFMGCAACFAYLLSRGILISMPVPSLRRRGVFPVDLQQKQEHDIDEKSLEGDGGGILDTSVSFRTRVIEGIFTFIALGGGFASWYVTLPWGVLTGFAGTAFVTTIGFQYGFLCNKFSVFLFHQIENVARVFVVIGTCTSVAGVSPDSVNLFSGGTFFFCMFLLRGLRVTMTTPGTGAFELLLSLAIFKGDTVLVPFGMFSVGFVLERLLNIFRKMHFAWLHVFSAARSDKLRLPTRFLSICLLPTQCLIVATIAAFLDSPIVPIAGMPIFTVGFPRPKKLWPCPTLGSNDTVDAQYYVQVYPRIVAALPNLLWRKGVIHPSRFGDTMLLIRFEKMIAWVSFFEAEYGYAVVYVKGLELQEPTSCHNVEANALDALIERTFKNGTVASDSEDARKTACCHPSPRITHILEPLCKQDIQSYSHAKITLTGVIENPEFIKLVDKTFMYSLVWVLHKNQDKLDQQRQLIPNALDEREIKLDMFPEQWYNYLQGGKANHPKEEEGDHEDGGPCGPGGPLGDDFDLDALLDEIDHHQETTSSISEYDRISPPRPKPSTRESFEASKDVVEDTPQFQQTRKKKMNSTKKKLSSNKVDSFDDILSSLNVLDESKDDQGEPTSNPGEIIPNKRSTRRPSKSRSEFKGYAGVSSMLAQAFDVDDDVNQNQHSRNQMPSPSPEGDPPMIRPSSILNMLNDVLDDSNTDGIETTTSTKLRKNGHHERAVEINEAIDSLTNTCLFMYGLYNRFGVYNNVLDQVGSAHIVDCFHGKLAPSYQLKALEKAANDSPLIKELLTLSNRAYRLGFKLALDAYLLGDPDPGLQDFVANETVIKEYENDWFLGTPDEAGWADAIHHEKPNLLALIRSSNGGKDPPSALQLTLQTEHAYVCSIKSDIARGLWASLSMELYYFTNDDDERYSIQAHPQFLRNIVIQAADPPLGYPVFASAPQTIHI